MIKKDKIYTIIEERVGLQTTLCYSKNLKKKNTVCKQYVNCLVFV